MMKYSNSLMIFSWLFEELEVAQEGSKFESLNLAVLTSGDGSGDFGHEIPNEDLSRKFTF